MSDEIVEYFPIFPLSLVALPTELEPLHIFEARYKAMVKRCIDEDNEFGLIWLSDDGLQEIGCCCEVVKITEEFDDGHFDILTRGVKPFKLLQRNDQFDYPTATIELLKDVPEPIDFDTSEQAHDAYNQLVESVTETPVDPDRLVEMTAYQMAATVEFGLEAKQNLLNLRSENARLDLTTRLFRAALQRVQFIDKARARAKSNGKVRFG